MKHFLQKSLPVLLSLLPFTLKAQIVNIEEQRITGTNDTTNWYGFLRLGGSLVKVKEQVLQLNATSQVQFKKDPHLILLLLDGKFLRTGEQNFANAGFAHLRYNYKFTDKLVLEVFTQAQYNQLLLIGFRSLAGAGLRYRIFKDMPGRNRIYAGMAYLYEYNSFLEDRGNSRWHRLSSYVSFTFRPWGNTKLVNTTYFQPQLFDLSNYRLSSEWRLEFQLNKHLSFMTDFAYSRDHSLPDEAPLSTYTWLNGLTWKL